MQKKASHQKRPAPRGRPSHRGLDRSRVLSAAVALADSDGLAGVTMRALAGELGVEPMSLYSHLAGKDGLLDGLLERVVAEINDETAKLTRRLRWRTTVRQRCLAARTVMLRHRWAPSLLATRTAIPTGVLLHYEGILATMIHGGFTYQLAHRALHALGSMPLGFVNELFAPAAATPKRTSEEPAEAAIAEAANTLPHLAAMVTAEVDAHGGDTLGWCDSQTEFEFTLDLLLEGLQRRARSGRRTPTGARGECPACATVR